MNTLPRYILPCAVIGCASVQAAPFLAIGDSAELFVTATTGVRYEDNTLLVETNEVDDVILEFVPGIELVFGKNAGVSGTFVAQEQFSHYLDNDELDSNLTNLLFNANYEQARLTLKTNASYRRLQQNDRDIANAATQTRRDIYAAGVNGELSLTEKTKFGAGISYSETVYKTAGFNDSYSFSVPLNYYYAITPKVDLSAGLTHRETYVDGGADSKDDYLNVGARGDFTSKLSGRFSVGYTQRNPDLGSDESLFGMDFDLDYALSPKTNLNLSLSNDFSSSAAGGTTYEVLSAGLTASTQVSAQLTLSSGVRYQQADYDTGRSDDFITFNASGSYAFNKHISGVLSYSFQQNDSSAVGNSFTANVVSLSAVFRY